MHVIGTAGHVDHGKSSLVLALTGIDPDRLAEEKQREMTIDLGFAWLRLGDDEVGVVDVPGHRDFIENMLAGVGGIDLALLVIAADEGVMPQTREHLAILDLLEIPRGVVALTKIDMVPDPDWLELVTLEIGETLVGTALQDAPIVPVSSRTGAGLDHLRQVLIQQLAYATPRTDHNRPRLPIDRVFSLQGFGTVVTGTLIDGQIRLGDEVEIAPGSISCRVRGIQTHKTRREVALPGSRVAINLGGVDKRDVRRGQVVARPNTVRPSTLVDAIYRHLDSEAGPLRHNTEVKFFSGTAEVTGHVRVIGQEQIEPRGRGWIQIALSEPVVVLRGDRFILRRLSPGETLGGGRVLDPVPGRRHRRFRPDVRARFEALEAGTPEELLLHTLEQLGLTTAPDLLNKASLASDQGRQTLDSLIAQGHVLSIGKHVVSRASWEALLAGAVAAVTAYHQSNPLRLGLDREELRSRLRLPGPVFVQLAGTLVAAAQLTEVGTLLRLPTHTIAFDTTQQSHIQKLRRQMTELGVNSPSVKECKAVVGEVVYTALVDLGELCPVSDDVVYLADDYRRVIDAIISALHQSGSTDAAEVRNLLGTSRKYAIALLEHLDALHITRRVGDRRELAGGAR